RPPSLIEVGRTRDLKPCIEVALYRRKLFTDDVDGIGTERQAQRPRACGYGAHDGRGGFHRITALGAVVAAHIPAHLAHRVRVSWQFGLAPLERATSEVGAKAPGLDDGHTDSKRCEFERQRFGKPFDSVFGCTIKTATGDADHAGYRRKIHDM